jgi:hypothetical protein
MDRHVFPCMPKSGTPNRDAKILNVAWANQSDGRNILPTDRSTSSDLNCTNGTHLTARNEPTPGTHLFRLEKKETQLYSFLDFPTHASSIASQPHYVRRCAVPHSRAIPLLDLAAYQLGRRRRRGTWLHLRAVCTYIREYGQVHAARGHACGKTNRPIFLVSKHRNNSTPASLLTTSITSSTCVKQVHAGFIFVRFWITYYFSRTVHSFLTTCEMHWTRSTMHISAVRTCMPLISIFLNLDWTNTLFSSPHKIPSTCNFTTCLKKTCRS